MSENHPRVFEDPNEARVRNLYNFTPMSMKITIGITYCLFVVVAVEV